MTREGKAGRTPGMSEYDNGYAAGWSERGRCERVANEPKIAALVAALREMLNLADAEALRMTKPDHEANIRHARAKARAALKAAKGA